MALKLSHVLKISGLELSYGLTNKGGLNPQMVMSLLLLCKPLPHLKNKVVET